MRKRTTLVLKRKLSSLLRRLNFINFIKHAGPCAEPCNVVKFIINISQIISPDSFRVRFYDQCPNLL